MPSQTKIKKPKKNKAAAAAATPALKKVLIATPCYNGLVGHSYMQSIINVILMGPSYGYKIETYTLTDSLVTRARNNAVATFLDGDWDYLFWIDADISFKPDQFFRLLAIDRDITAGAYPLKTLFYPTEPKKLAGRELAASMLRYAINLSGDIENIPTDGFVEAKEAATGFMCIKREVFDMLKQVYPHLKYQSDQNGLGAPESDNHYLFFDTLVMDGRYLSEDYAFCKRVADIGMPVWLDLQSALTHTGTFDFVGSLMETSQANS